MTEKTDPPEKATLKMGDLRSIIAESVKDAVKGLTPGESPTTDDGSDSSRIVPQGAVRQQSVAEAVQTELAKIAKEKQDAEEKKSVSDQLAALDKKVNEEKPPVQRTRRHRFMGWGEPTE